MRSQTLDAEALRAISPASLSAFARAEGWVRTEPYGAHADVYSAARREEIVVPRTALLGDYAAVVCRLIQVFADASGRDQLAVYRDLADSDRDVIRVRASRAGDDGSVVLERGVALIEQARDMLLAAACAAHSRQAFYRAGANKEASDFMGRVRLGQTERGSYVVTMLSPVPPALPSAQMPLDASWVEPQEEPMERRVTRCLVTALCAARTAVEHTASGIEGAFDEAIKAGVSANLCDAVAGLIEQSDRLDVSVTWARTRPTPETRSSIRFSATDAAFLKEAARHYRRRQPRMDEVLFGTIAHLTRRQGDLLGTVILQAIIDNRMQAVRAIFDPSSYSIAVRVHDEKATAIFKGDLERVGQRWQLNRATVQPMPVDASEDLTADEAA